MVVNSDCLRNTKSTAKLAVCGGVRQAGNHSRCRGLIAHVQRRETAMKTARLALIGTAVLVTTVASAQQEMTGTVTMVARPDHSVAIQRAQEGTVGASTGTIDVLRVPETISLDPVHVGDTVTYGVTEQGGVKTVTKIEKAKP
jgi:hypothetical protein